MKELIKLYQRFGYLRFYPGISIFILPMLSYPGCHVRNKTLVVLELTHMVVKCRQCLVKVLPSRDIASQIIQELLEAYFKIFQW